MVDTLIRETGVQVRRLHSAQVLHEYLDRCFLEPVIELTALGAGHISPGTFTRISSILSKHSPFWAAMYE